MNNPKSFKERVVDAVKERLKDKPWYQGVCLDTIKDFREDQFDEAVNSCTNETIYWDAPNSGF